MNSYRPLATDNRADNHFGRRLSAFHYTPITSITAITLVRKRRDFQHVADRSAGYRKGYRAGYPGYSRHQSYRGYRSYRGCELSPITNLHNYEYESQTLVNDQYFNALIIIWWWSALLIVWVTAVVIGGGHG